MASQIKIRDRDYEAREHTSVPGSENKIDDLSFTACLSWERERGEGTEDRSLGDKRQNERVFHQSGY